MNTVKSADETREWIVVYLDTSVMINYPVLDSIVWKDITKRKAVELRVSQPVLHEISYLKDNGKTRTVRDRAKRLTRRVLDFLAVGPRAEIREGEFIVLEIDAPSVKDFPELKDESADDKVLAAVLTFKKNSPIPVSLAIDDFDVTLRMKVNKWGINYVVLPEKLRYLDEPDPVERENQRLRKELEEINTAAPILTMSFLDGKDHIFWQLKPNDIEEHVRNQMKELREKNPPMSNEPPSLDLNWISFAPERYTRIRDWNRELEDALKETEMWIYGVETKRTNTINIGLRIDNSGSSPAHDVEVCLKFPEFTEVADEECYLKMFLPQPELPQRPALERYTDLIPRKIIVPELPTPLFAELRVTEQYGSSMKVQVRRLRQRDFVILPKIHAIFDDAPRSFKISFTIRADNMHNIVQGDLHVRVDK
jgi:hypothetical protein